VVAVEIKLGRAAGVMSDVTLSGALSGNKSLKLEAIVEPAPSIAKRIK